MINVLVVDDLPENIFTLEHILDNGTRKFIPAASGAEALLLASMEKIDLILLDFKLDDMDGMEVAKQLRSNPITARPPGAPPAKSGFQPRAQPRSQNEPNLPRSVEPIVATAHSRRARSSASAPPALPTRQIDLGPTLPFPPARCARYPTR